jgi:hypothetical protein
MAEAMTTPPTCNCGPACTWPGCELTCEGRVRMDKVHKAERMAAAQPAHIDFELAEREAKFQLYTHTGLELECDCPHCNSARAYVALSAKLADAHRDIASWRILSDQQTGQIDALRAQLAAAVETLRDARPYVEIEASEQDSMTVKDALELLRKIDAALARAAPGEAAERSRGKGAQEHE